MPIKYILAALIAGIALCAFYLATFPLVICENCAINHAGYWAMTLGVVLIALALLAVLIEWRSWARFRLLAPALLVGATLGLSACSDGQVASTNARLDKYDHSLDNFNTIVSRYNQSIAKTDASAKPYCDDAVATGNEVGRIVGGNDVALKALDGLTSGLKSYCGTPVNDVSTAVRVLAKAIADGRAAVRGGK